MCPAFLVGLDFEAAILRRAGVGALIAIARQGDAAIARQRLEALIAAGADGLVSFGIAGALDPALAAGALMLPEAVIDHVSGSVLTTDADWRAAVAKDIEAHGGRLVTVATAIAGVDDKAALRRQTGAVAVDMESAIAGRLASERGLPFLVVRAIADEAGQSLPQAVLAGVDADGKVMPWATLTALVRRPGDLPALIRLARATALAKRTLGAVAVEVLRTG